MSAPSRYASLLRVCDMAVAQAVATHAEFRPDFWETVATALEDDCPQQSAAAARIAARLRKVAADQRKLRDMLDDEGGSK